MIIFWIQLNSNTALIPFLQTTYRQLRTQPRLRKIIFDKFLMDRAEKERKSEDFRALLEKASLTAR